MGMDYFHERLRIPPDFSPTALDKVHRRVAALTPADLQTLLAEDEGEDPFGEGYYDNESLELHRYRLHHYRPRSIGGRQTQFGAGPQAAGTPELYELALNVLAAFVPPETDGYEPVTIAPRAPVGYALRLVSQIAWDLHRPFADEVLTGLTEAQTVIPARDVYLWISRRRPDLADTLLAPPAPEPDVPF